MNRSLQTFHSFHKVQYNYFIVELETDHLDFCSPLLSVFFSHKLIRVDVVPTFKSNQLTHFKISVVLLKITEPFFKINLYAPSVSLKRLLHNPILHYANSSWIKEIMTKLVLDCQ